MATQFVAKIPSSNPFDWYNNQRKATNQVILPYFTTALHYHRIVTSMDMVHHRYTQINRLLIEFQTIRSSSTALYESLYGIYHVHSELYHAKQLIHARYKWSLLMVTINDFAQFTLFGYIRQSLKQKCA